MLNSERTVIGQIFDYDPATDRQIVDTYDKEIFARLIDITGIVPMPEVGWIYNGIDFSPPPLIKIESIVHDSVKYCLMEVLDNPNIVNQKTNEWTVTLMTYFRNLVVKARNNQPLTVAEIISILVLINLMR